MTPEEIKGLREALGLTQEAFARKLGVSYQTVNRWENAKRVPTGLYLKALEQLQRKAAKTQES